MSRTFAVAFLAVASALAFAACGGGGNDTPNTALPRPTGTTAAQCVEAPLAGLTWANFGDALFSTNCVTCHNGLGGPGQPPASVNFTSYAGVVLHLDHIDSHAAANPNGSVVNTLMPPAGGLALLDRQKLACWIATGAPEGAAP